MEHQRERAVACRASTISRVEGVTAASYHETMAKSSRTQSEVPYAGEPSMWSRNPNLERAVMNWRRHTL